MSPHNNLNCVLCASLIQSFFFEFFMFPFKLLPPLKTFVKIIWFSTLFVGLVHILRYSWLSFITTHLKKLLITFYFYFFTHQVFFTFRTLVMLKHSLLLVGSHFCFASLFSYLFFLARTFATTHHVCGMYYYIFKKIDVFLGSTLKSLTWSMVMVNTKFLFYILV